MKNLVKCGMVLCLVMAFMFCQVASAEDVVKLHGSVTMGKLIESNKAAIESASGAKIEVVGNGSGRGLSDLASGAAEVALIGGTLKGVAEVENADKPGSVDTTGMVEIPVGSVEVSMTVHPSAGVTSLTAKQAADIFTGKVKNWKDVGGADQEVKVVLPFKGDGIRIIIKEDLLGGAEYTSDAIERNTAKDVIGVINQLPGSCAILTVKNIEGEAKRVTLDRELGMPMILVMKGSASETTKKVAEAAKVAFGK